MRLFSASEDYCYECPRLSKKLKIALDVLEDIEKNWDHEHRGSLCSEEDLHEQTQCRCCIAKAALKYLEKEHV